jgi:hypothetical protein
LERAIQKAMTELDKVSTANLRHTRRTNSLNNSLFDTDSSAGSSIRNELNSILNSAQKSPAKNKLIKIAPAAEKRKEL